MYTIKDIVSGNFVLLNEYDLLKIEDVVSVTTLMRQGKDKKIIINVDLVDYLFSSDLKKLLKSKVKSDLGEFLDVKFGIAF